MKEDFSLMRRLVGALERLAPLPPLFPERDAVAYLWHGSGVGLEALSQVRHLPLELIRAVDGQKALLLQNTEQFSRGFAANNVLLWGARGVGKSSLVKSVCAHVHQTHSQLCLVEIPRGELASLPELLRLLGTSERRCVVFCDDLSFEPEDQAYQTLKSVLDGGLLDASGEVLFYATSNRRHLMTRSMSENEVSEVIHHGELRDERLSLTDRFGLWIGFHHIDQEVYLEIIVHYADYYGLNWSHDREDDVALALRWSRQRGGRSGRVAWQFVCDLAGREGTSLRPVGA